MYRHSASAQSGGGVFSEGTNFLLMLGKIVVEKMNVQVSEDSGIE